MTGEHVQTPIVYLREMPERIEIGWFGNPYLVCPTCEDGALVTMQDPQGHGSMLVCARGCGQRFWVDATDPKDDRG